MLFAGLELARRIEAAEVRLSMETAGVHARLYPDKGAASEAVAGGCATYVGVGSPLTHALGLGVNGPLSEREIERIEEFYRSRGAAAELVLCPLADHSLLEVLGPRGYRLKELENVLARPLAKVEPAPQPPRGVKVRRAEAGDAERSARTVAGAFLEGREIGPDAIEMFSLVFHAPSAANFLAFVDGEAAAGAMAAMHGGVAAFFGAGTLPRFRNRGLQTALLYARLESAAAAGCDLAVVTTRPGATSQRNAERLGFRVVYTRFVMLRE
ncbi:MAG: GNAT family N-acetyltransferase [Bryobacteraceae bacterium]